MVSADKQRPILLIGADSQLDYLLQRYAERSGCHLTTSQAILPVGEMVALQPALIIFLSLELLETAQELVEQLVTHDIPIAACASAAGEARARELGADYCLLHPVTYDNFQAALTAPSGSKQS